MTQDIIIRSEAGKPMAEADNEAIRQMQALAQKATKSADGERQRIHLILRNQQLADILKRTPLSEALAEQVEPVCLHRARPLVDGHAGRTAR